ncbi:MAG: DUF3089 domain-containing protein [Actinobacteria bacterium]|nr:DUF3089 domain-containing protein [Actinomycetota bacterium]
MSTKAVAVVATIAMSLTAWFGLPAGAGAATGPSSDPYSDPGSWICRPDLPAAQNPCEGDISTTRVDGVWPFLTRTNITPPRPAISQRPVDCFYIYPTVASHDTIAQEVADQSIRDTVKWQVEQYSSLCRVFAPGYRQSPVGANAAQVANAYSDVLAAWNHYLTYDNQGRGVILIGHSQGSLMLRELIHNQIDPNSAVRSRLVGAFLFGGNVMVAPGRTTGGDFTNIPVCTAKGQYGCVVAYSTYDTDPGFELFGNAMTDGLNGDPIFQTKFFDDLPKGAGYQVACTDPGVLSGMTGSFGIRTPYADGSVQWTGFTLLEGINPPSVSTAWVDAFDYTGSCRTINGANVFRYQPATWWSPTPTALPMMGTHEIDANLGVGRLLQIAGLQIQGWTAAQH